MVSDEGSGAATSWGLGLCLALCSISGVMSAIVMVPILPELFRVFADVPNVSFWLPTLMTIPGLCAALFSPLAGYLGDRVGSKWLIVASLVLYVVFGIAPVVLDDFWAIFISRIGLGIAQTGVLVISIALISQYFSGAAREKWLALQAAAATSSAVILLPMSGLLASGPMAWHGSFLIFLLGLVLAVFIAFQRAGSVADERAQDHGSSTIPWRWLLGQCAITTASGLVFFSTQFQLGLAFATVGITDTTTIGLFSALASAGIVVGTILFMPAKRLLGSALLPVELCLAGVALVVVWQFQSIAVLVVFSSIAMMACGMMLPTLVTAVAAGLPDAVRGRGLGMWNSSFTIAQFLGAALVGAVLAQPGKTVLDAFGYLGIGAIAFAALLLLLAPRPRVVAA